MNKKETYKNYLKSDLWRQRKNKFLQGKENICFICQEKSDYTNVHHNKYRDWGKEKDEDLVLLCEECHLTLHTIISIWGKKAHPTSTLHIRMRDDKKLRTIFE